MENFKIPTLDELDDRLNGLGRLAAATEWERAAIVWAHTHEGEVDRDPLFGNFARMSITTLAARGYYGLKSHHTVRRYHREWQQLVADGSVPATIPGAEVEVDFNALGEFPRPNDPHLVTAGTAYETGEERAAVIRQLADDLGGAKGAIRVATSSPSTLQVVAQTATPEQAKALTEGLRRRGLDQSEPYVRALNVVQELNAQQVKKALEDPAIADQVVADKSARASVRRALDERYENAPKLVAPVLASKVPGSEPFELLSEFRKLHIAMDRIVKLVIGGRAVVNDQERDALLSEVKWLRAALDHTESGLTAHSLDEALRAFQEEWL